MNLGDLSKQELRDLFLKIHEAYFSGYYDPETTLAERDRLKTELEMILEEIDRRRREGKPSSSGD